MSAIIYLTQAPTKITATPARQLIQNAVEVAAYRHLVLLLEVLAIVGGGDYEVVILTGMQLDTEDGWIQLGTYGSQTVDGPFKIDLTDALRYIRWEVKTLTGTTPHVTFVISGVARS